MKKMEASLFLGVGKKYMKGGACLNQSGSSAEFKIDYVENQKRDAKNKKFKEIYWNLNFALQKIMEEASIIGESEDLTVDNFPATFELKVSKEEDSPDQMYYSDEESISAEKNDPHQSNAEFKSSNLLPKNCHINSVQNQNPISLDSSECGPFNLKFKYTDTSEEVAVKYDNIKCVAKYSSELKKAPCEPPSNCKKIHVNMKSNLRKLYKCHEPLCGYFTLDQSNFKKHNLVHSKYKVKEGTDFNSVPHKMTRPEGGDIIGKEANHDEHNILHCFDGVDGNSLVDKSVQCSLCDFFCFTSVGLKRHYIRYHSNKETQDSSESLGYCEDECTNSSDASLDGEDQLKRCSSCSFESQSSSLMIKHEKKHHQAGNDRLLGTSTKNFKCFECDFETPHRITLVCHEKEHSNFVNKVKIKNKNITHFARKNRNASRKCTSTMNSLDLQSSKLMKDEQCCLKNARLYDQQNVDSCLDEYQQFKSDIDFEEKEEYHTTVGCKKRKNSSDEKTTMYRKVDDVYHCGSCSYITSQKYCINNHILIHFKDKRLKCGHCCYATNLVGNLNQHHELIHQKTKKYACKLCDFKSNYFRDIRLHHKRSHRRYPS